MVAVLLAIAVLVLVAVVASTWTIVREMQAARQDVSRARIVALMDLFAPAVGEAQRDPRALLVWEPLARTARAIAPAEMAALDAATGSTFPFSAAVVQQAHADWTTDWLAWERAHDAEYKLKASEIEHQLAESGGAPLLRARLDQVEREKLDRYQHRYQEYVRVAKALQALAAPSSRG